MVAGANWNSVVGGVKLVGMLLNVCWLARGVLAEKLGAGELVPRRFAPRPRVILSRMPLVLCFHSDIVHFHDRQLSVAR